MTVCAHAQMIQFHVRNVKGTKLFGAAVLGVCAGSAGHGRSANQARASSSLSPPTLCLLAPCRTPPLRRRSWCRDPILTLSRPADWHTCPSLHFLHSARRSTSSPQPLLGEAFRRRGTAAPHHHSHPSTITGVVRTQATRGKRSSATSSHVLTPISHRRRLEPGSAATVPLSLGQGWTPSA